MDRRDVVLPDGRTVEVHVAGPLDRPVVVAHHGTPSTAAVWNDWVAPLDEAGLTLVAYSRPGYAGSTPHPGRRVSDAANDTVGVLDALGVREAVCLGYSGGCPHALAVGALAPDRCPRVVVVAGVVPFDAFGVDFTDGMGEENVAEFAAAVDGVEALERWMAENAGPLLTAGADDIADAFGDLVDESDRAVLTGQWAADVAADFHRVHAGGTNGWVDDDLAFVSPWGFTPADVRVPVVIWHAGRDRMAPVSHSRWMAGALPSADYREVGGLGHLALLVNHRASIIASLQG